MAGSSDYFLLVVTLVLTVVSYLATSDENDKITMYDIWYYGWITAIATGLGVIPFFFVSSPNKYWMGISNGGLDLNGLDCFK